MHFACGIFEIGGFWCEIEKHIIFGRFELNGGRNRREVDHSGSNALVHASADVLGIDFEKANRPPSSQHLLGVKAYDGMESHRGGKRHDTFDPPSAPSEHGEGTPPPRTE